MIRVSMQGARSSSVFLYSLVDAPRRGGGSHFVGALCIALCIQGC
jgi:hypothetical protein